MMNRILFGLGLSCLCLGGSLFAQTVDPDYIDGQVFVRFKDGTDSKSAILQKSVKVDAIPQISRLRKKFKIRSADNVAYRMKSQKINHTIRVHFDEIEKVSDLIDELSVDPEIEFVERIPLYRTFYRPNDARHTSMWYMPVIEAEAAWEYSKGSKDIVIAVTDDGMQVDHPDLQANFWNNPKEIPNNNRDDDGNGYVDDVVGWDAADDDPDPTTMPGNSHGTHVSGSVSAVSDNGTGVSSIGFGCSIMGIKCTNMSGGGLNATYDGVIYAIQSGAADVINMSWGGGGFSQQLQDIFTAAKNAGIVCVAAAGNDNTSQRMYPAAFEHVISVVATASGDVKASFSNYGEWTDISAPGNQILSTVPGSGYQSFSGTSMASPITAGLCGLMLSLDPGMTPDEVESCLLSTADNISGNNSNYQGQMGAGRINARKAMECVSNNLSSPPIADFEVDVDACNGVVTFVNKSRYKPESFLWEFGDGKTSTEESPVHEYNSSGKFNVKLKVTNQFGNDEVLKEEAFEITRPSMPEILSDEFQCGSGPFNFEANGEHDILWYASEDAENPLGEGNNYSLNNGGSLYVENALLPDQQKVGPEDNTFSAGDYYDNNAQGLYFDVMSPMMLNSVYMYTETAGVRTVQVVADGSVIREKEVNIPSGGARVELGFLLNPGEKYLIKIGSGEMNLFRTEGGAQNTNTGATYPYEINGLVRITESTAIDAGDYYGYYYFFYDWEVQEPSCKSARVKVEAVEKNVTKPQIAQDGYLLTSSQASQYQWYLDGEELEGETSRSLEATEKGNYSVKTWDNEGCSAVSDELYFDSTNSVYLPDASQMTLYPNPTNDMVHITVVGFDQVQSIQVLDQLGRVVAEQAATGAETDLSVNGLPNGVYYVNVRGGNQSVVSKLVVRD